MGIGQSGLVDEICPALRLRRATSGAKTRGMETWRTTAERVARAALDVFIPRRCAACDAASLSEASPFCPTCETQWTRAEPVDDATWTWFSYAGPVARAVTRAKYGPDEAIGRSLARSFRAELRASPVPLDVDLVTYVPAHWRRRVMRRFDLPQLFAAELARALDRPLVAALRSTQHTKPRAQAGHDDVPTTRFAVVRPVAGKRVLLVDDVHTTGATLRAASAVLVSAGAQVTCAAYAHTPLPAG